MSNGFDLSTEQGRKDVFDFAVNLYMEAHRKLSTPQNIATIREALSMGCIFEDWRKAIDHKALEGFTQTLESLQINYDDFLRAIYERTKAEVLD